MKQLTHSQIPVGPEACLAADFDPAFLPDLEEAPVCPRRAARRRKPVKTPPAEDSDEALMARLAESEPRALRQLVERYSRVITGVIYNVLRNEAESEEILMEVFLHSWNHAAQYSPEKGKPLGWLVTMARRRGIDRLRKRQRYSKATDRLEAEVRNDPGAWITSHDASIEAERADLCAQVRRKLEELPPPQRQAIEYAYYKGMSQREIAAATGIPLGTIKTRIELGLKKLSSSLQSLNRELALN